jgi:hypothetical protein
MANLIDNYTADGDLFYSNFDGSGGVSGLVHGYTSTETVFWNTVGIKAHPTRKYLIDSTM